MVSTASEESHADEGAGSKRRRLDSIDATMSGSACNEHEALQALLSVSANSPRASTRPLGKGKGKGAEEAKKLPAGAEGYSGYVRVPLVLGQSVVC